MTTNTDDVISYADGFPPGTRAWSKIRGHPFWPSMILKLDQVSDEVMKARYANGAGCIPVQFYEDHSGGWVPKDAFLTMEAGIEKFAKKGKKVTKSLAKAIKEATDDEFEFVSLKDLELRRNKHALVGSDDDDDEEDVDAEDVEEAEEAEGRVGQGDAKSKKAANPRRRDSKSGGSKSGASSAARKRSLVEGDDGDDAKSSKKAKASAADRAQKDRVEKPPQEKLLTLRHRLQRIFLSGEIRTEDFDKVEELLSRVESFKVDREMLMTTKIAKVLKRITVLDLGATPPADIKTRSHKILHQWHDLLTSTKSDGGEDADAEKKAEKVEQAEQKEEKPVEQNEGKPVEQKAEKTEQKIVEQKEEKAEHAEKTAEQKEEKSEMGHEEKSDEKAEKVPVTSNSAPASDAVMTEATPTAAPTNGDHK